MIIIALHKRRNVPLRFLREGGIIPRDLYTGIIPRIYNVEVGMKVYFIQYNTEYLYKLVTDFVAIFEIAHKRSAVCHSLPMNRVYLR